MTNPFEDLDVDDQNTWNALDLFTEVTVSDAFEARLMSQIESIENTVSATDKPQWAQWVDNVFNLLHVPALAMLIAILFWLPTQAPAQTAQSLSFPEIETHRSLKDQHNPVLKPEKILNLLIHISRS